MSIFYQNNGERLRFYTSENNTYESHLHRQVELILVLRGALTVTTDQEHYPLEFGQGVLVFPNQSHRLNTDPRRGSRILLCIFDMDFCPHYRRFFQYYVPGHNAFSLDDLTDHSRLAQDKLLYLTKQFQRGAPVPQYISNLAEGYLTLLLADLFREDGPNLLQLQKKKDLEDMDLEHRLLVYLDSHYTEPLSLEILSKEFGVSRFQLSRLFSDKLHTSFPSYVTSRRLEYAKELLSTTDTSVTGIALDAGFGSPRTFFREFREAYGTTPSDYRKQHPKA